MTNVFLAFKSIASGSVLPHQPHTRHLCIYHHDISKKEFLWSRLQQSSCMQHKMLVLTGRRDDTNLVCTAVPGKNHLPDLA